MSTSLALATSTGEEPRSRPLARRNATLQRWRRGSLGLLALAAVWWLVSALPAESSLAAHFAPAPVLAAGLELLTSGALWTHAWLSLQRVAFGLLSALLLGGPLGVAIGSSRRFDELTSPSVQFLRMISPVSWMPLAVLLFGVGEGPVWFLLAFAATWPILLNTAAGVRALQPRWLELGRSLAASRRELFLQIVLPGILPSVLTGLRLAIGISWIVLVPAEMLGVSVGLGYFILDARDRLAYSQLMALILIVGALGFALDSAARWLCSHGQHATPAA